MFIFISTSLIVTLLRCIKFNLVSLLSYLSHFMSYLIFFYSSIFFLFHFYILSIILCSDLSHLFCILYFTYSFFISIRITQRFLFSFFICYFPFSSDSTHFVHFSLTSLIPQRIFLMHPIFALFFAFHFIPLFFLQYFTNYFPPSCYAHLLLIFLWHFHFVFSLSLKHSIFLLYLVI